MSAKPLPSVAVMKLSKSQYIELADRFRDSAQTAHQDMRAWMNRALLAESQLAARPAESDGPNATRKDTRN